MDNISSEFLYWHEESNTHQWLKPATHSVAAKMNAALNFKINDEVSFRFPGDYKDEIGMVSRIRYDDETGDEMYDVVRTVVKEGVRYPMEDCVPVTWVARFRVKKPILDKETLMLQRLEVGWRDQLRRQKAAEERRKKKMKQDRLNEALAKIRDKLLAVQSEDTGPAVNSDGIEVVVVKSNDEAALATNKEKMEAQMNAAELLEKGLYFI
jgi:hypothetical protein